MRIDSHQHFWIYDPVKSSWMNEEIGVLKRNYLPNDLEGILKENKIDGCVSVQADQSEDETFFLLQHAEKYSFIKGVVGWVDLRSSKIEERLNYFSKYSKLCGFRHIVQSEPEGFMLKKEFQQGIEKLKQYNFTYDILIYPNQLNDALKLVEKFPDQKMIIDHLAKPYIKDKKSQPWASQIREISQNKNVYCKLSGMATEANWKNWKQEDFKPYLDVVFESFGEDRLLFGSDWPVCLLAGKYAEALNVIENYLEGTSEKIKSKIMGLNAMKFYNLKF